MYAKLCHQLCREAPNFEPESSNISTFRRLLLNKCQDEFENRSKTVEAFDTENGLSEEELEQRFIAKSKMLGNIKFIGELGKLEMLHEGILHRCIKQLLDKKKNVSVAEMAEDLECLCQIMTTVGQRLDTPKAKAWMDKYFSRIKVFMGTEELPSRIRFMLQDVIDLRESKWKSRREAWDLGPKTITQIRQEAADESGIFIPQQGRMGGGRSTMNGAGFGFPPTSVGAFGDFFGMPSNGMMAGSTLGTGPGVIQVDGYVPTYTPKQRNSPQTQGYNTYQKRPDSGSPRTQRHNFQGQQGGGGRLSPQSQPGQQSSPQSTYQQQNSFQQQKNKTTLPPRLARLQQQQQQQQQQQALSPQQAIMMQVDGQMPIPMPNTSVPPPNLNKQEEINLRPNRNYTTALRPSVPTMLPKSAQAAPSTGPPMMSGSQFMSEQRANNLNPLLAKQAAVTIKQVPQEKLNHVKKKSEPSKEDVQKAAKNMTEEYLVNGDVDEAIASLKELNAPMKYLPKVISDMMLDTIDRTDEQRENVMRLIVAMKQENLIKSTTFMDGFKAVLDQMSDLEADVPLVKSYVARFAAYAVSENIISLLDLAEPMEQGTFYPLFLICLQQMLKLRDSEWLVNVFNESKMDLQIMLPEVDRSKERMMEILEERGLSFMFPLLRVQSELWRQIQAEPSATALFKWIKEKVSENLHHTSGFINILTTCVLRYVTSESTLCNDTITSNPDKAATEKEKQLLDKMKGVLQLLVNDRTDLQMHCLYAAQVFCHTNQFPKGMLLRLFMDFYDMEIVEEEVFFKWKEEVNDEYPGKGKALFQVNQWLTWLEEAEEESEEED